jgi:hypothetical protein
MPHLRHRSGVLRLELGVRIFERSLLLCRGVDDGVEGFGRRAKVISQPRLGGLGVPTGLIHGFELVRKSRLRRFKGTQSSGGDRKLCAQRTQCNGIGLVSALRSALQPKRLSQLRVAVREFVF